MLADRVRNTSTGKTKIVTYYGYVSPLTSSAAPNMGGSVGKYILLVDSAHKVGAYDGETGVRITLPELTGLSTGTNAYGEKRPIEIGNYCVLTGLGISSKRALIYDVNLIKALNDNFLTYSRSDLAAAIAGDGEYAVFAGGGVTNNYEVTNRVEAFSTSLVGQTLSNLSTKRKYHSGASVGGYAVFAGGYDRVNNAWVYLSSAQSYSSDLVRTTTPSLSRARLDMASASTKNHALFSGGWEDSYYSTARTDMYNVDLVRTYEAYTMGRGKSVGMRLGEYAVFIGGDYYRNEDPQPSRLVRLFSTKLVYTTLYLDTPRGVAVGGAAKKFGLVGGGRYYTTRNVWVDTVEAVILS